MVARLYPHTIKAGACAYNWKNHQPSVWYSEPIDDVEDFCRRLLDRALESWSMFLRPDEYDDTLQELVILVWKLESRYNPDKGASFRQYAAWIVSQRAVDYGPRRVLGRHGTRTHNYMSPSEDPYEGYSMGKPLSEQLVDDPLDRDSDLARVLSERSSELDEQDIKLGIRPSRTTPRRD